MSADDLLDDPHSGQVCFFLCFCAPTLARLAQAGIFSSWFGLLSGLRQIERLHSHLGDNARLSTMFVRAPGTSKRYGIMVL
jgi:hypothetical protein